MVAVATGEIDARRELGHRDPEGEIAFEILDRVGVVARSNARRSTCNLGKSAFVFDTALPPKEGLRMELLEPFRRNAGTANL